jgi:hypothetical protein
MGVWFHAALQLGRRLGDVRGAFFPHEGVIAKPGRHEVDIAGKRTCD